MISRFKSITNLIYFLNNGNVSSHYSNKQWAYLTRIQPFSMHRVVERVVAAIGFVTSFDVTADIENDTFLESIKFNSTATAASFWLIHLFRGWILQILATFSSRLDELNRLPPVEIIPIIFSIGFIYKFLFSVYYNNNSLRSVRILLLFPVFSNGGFSDNLYYIIQLNCESRTISIVQLISHLCFIPGKRDVWKIFYLTKGGMKLGGKKRKFSAK